MQQIRIGIVDDHKIFLDGIISLLPAVANVEVVFCSESGEEALEHLETNSNIDVLITDLTMKGLDGTKLCNEVNTHYPNIGILVLTMHDDPELVYASMQMGASGYVLKNADKDELVEAITCVANGKPYFHHMIKDKLLNKLAFPKKASKEPQDIKLTKREIEIIKLIATEHTTQEIADKLFISLYTVESHRKNIMRKTDVKNLAGLVRYAMKSKIVD